MKTHIFSKRRFLNKDTHHSIAAIAATLEHEEWEQDKYQYSPYTAEFYISNCERSISLVIDTYDSESLENSIFKIEQIEETAREYRKALISIRGDLKEWEKEKSAEEKKTEKK